MKNTKIEWAHHTVNFWWGCEFARLLTGAVRGECLHCYAKKLSAFFSKGKATWGADGQRWQRWQAAAVELSRLDDSARKRGVRERVFINSMSDTFEDRRDLDGARGVLFTSVERLTNLDVLLLTKRVRNVAGMVPPHWLWNLAEHHWPAHVWLGITAGTQQAADEDVPELLKIPARVRFLSCEPLLEAVDLSVGHALKKHSNCPLCAADSDRLGSIGWVICGGESGPGARPMQTAWARSLRDQCQAAGVPFFFKQWGEWKPDADFLVKVGKKLAGRVLDGREWNEVPS